MNLTKFGRLISHVYIFLLYIPNVGIGSDASKLYDKCPDPSSESMQNTYENVDKHEIISLIQLSVSPSMPPKSGMAIDSNEHGKNQAETNSQKPSCKIPFTNPDILNRFEHNTDIPLSRYQKFISLFYMRPTLLGDHAVLHQDTMPKENNMTLARQGTYGGEK